jgi:hypothetical protein
MEETLMGNACMEETLMGITHLQLREGKQPAYLQTGLRTATRGYQAATT